MYERDYWSICNDKVCWNNNFIFKFQIYKDFFYFSYNNKTYKVDDIEWNIDPGVSFETKSGPTTLLDYYKKVFQYLFCLIKSDFFLLFKNYNITIQDKGQPILISLPKEKDKRGGRNQPIYLIPELCVITGIKGFFF